MGAVGRTVTNVVKTVTQPLKKLVTAPGKLNIGDFATLGSVGTLAPVVDAVRHPGDIPILAGAALTAVSAGAGISALTAASVSDAAKTAAGSAADSASAYSSAFPSNYVQQTAGPSNALSLPSFNAPIITANNGTVGSSGLWGFLGRSVDAVKGLGGSILSGVGDATKALGGPLLNALLLKGMGGNGTRPGADGGGTYNPDGGGNSTPGTNSGSFGGGYTPFGSTAPMPGSPSSVDQSSLAGSTGSNVNLYLVVAAIIGIAYLLFAKKK